MLIIIAGTPYVGGIFKVKLTLGKDFPQTPPKAYFLTKIFHPNVASNGEICVNTLKKDWKPDLGIKHILLVRKRLFLKLRKLSQVVNFIKICFFMWCLISKSLKVLVISKTLRDNTILLYNECKSMPLNTKMDHLNRTLYFVIRNFYLLITTNFSFETKKMTFCNKKFCNFYFYTRHFCFKTINCCFKRRKFLFKLEIFNF